jgi:LPXTG-motif cell wall-anchored protein
VGLPEIGATAAGTPGAAATPVPTLPPFGAGNQSRQTPQAGNQSTATDANDAGDETTSFLIISAGVLSIALLAVGGLYLQRRRNLTR